MNENPIDFWIFESCMKYIWSNKRRYGKMRKNHSFPSLFSIVKVFYDNIIVNDSKTPCNKVFIRLNFHTLHTFIHKVNMVHKNWITKRAEYVDYLAIQGLTNLLYNKNLYICGEKTRGWLSATASVPPFIVLISFPMNIF